MFMQHGTSFFGTKALLWFLPGILVFRKPYEEANILWKVSTLFPFPLTCGLQANKDVALFRSPVTLTDVPLAFPLPSCWRCSWLRLAKRRRR